MFGPKHEPAFIALITGEPLGIERNGASINIFKSQLIPDGSGRRLPMIDICTVTDEEMSDRTSHGIEEIDVIEEFSSSIWFAGRSGFKDAWAIVRRIASGDVLPSNFQSGHIFTLTEDHSDPGSILIIDPSVHHIAPEVL